MVKHQRVTSTIFLMGASCFIVLLLFQASFLRVYPRPFLYPIYNMLTYANYTLIDVSNNYYSCDIVEVKQFHSLTRNHSTKFTRKHSAPVWKTYSHRVVSHCERDINGVVIVISELKRARPTHGGSSFRIMSMSYSLLQTCSFDDYFNGTYIAFCFLDRTSCINITIDLMYVDYMAYTDTRLPRNKFLWKKTICGTNCYSEQVTRRHAFPSFSPETGGPTKPYDMAYHKGLAEAVHS